ncbi:MAG: hypothetical protein HY952_10900 [Elusimicrobia bacterium]|nr:hypothetical protein [Elusimicrobiota bacterium]
MKKPFLPLLLLLGVAACSDKSLYPDAIKAFEKHSYLEYPAGQVRGVLEAKGFAGLAALDRHAAMVRSKRVVRQLPSRQAVSSGLLFANRRGGVYLAKVFQNSTAAAAGLKDGDKVLKIDGVAATPKEVAVRSDDSFGFVLETERPGVRGLSRATVQVAREQFVTPLIFGFYDPVAAVGYVKIGMFVQGSSATVLAGVEALTSLGAKKIVFDLRGNGGGMPEEAAGLLGAFAPKAGAVLELKSRHPGYCRTFQARGRGKYADVKTAVLTDGSTFMAAEIFAQSLKELAGARLVGGPTGGKVSLLRTFRLGRGAQGLELTVARMFPPSGLDLEEKGAIPDVDVKLTPEREKDMNEAWDDSVEAVLLVDKAYAAALETLSK